jgi:hypothetical protein
MAATGGAAGTLSAVLKEFYLGPIAEQINQEVMVCELFEKASVDWNGRSVIIPVHTARNTAVGYAAENGALPGPAAGALGASPSTNQSFSRLVVQAQFLYGRFQISGPAMEAASKGGSNSFVSYVDAEMTRLVEDVKDRCNRVAVSGGRVLGFLAETNVIGAAGPDDFLFDGDFAKAAAVFADVTAGSTTDMCDIIRLDTFAVAVAAVDMSVAPTPGSGLISLQGPAAAAVTLPATAAVGSARNCFALVISDNGRADMIAVTATSGEGDPDAQPVGIYGNLASPTHFTVDRTDATGSPILQGVCVTTVADGAAGAPANTRVAQTLAQYQGAFDALDLTGGGQPDLICMHPLQRTRYSSLFTANVRADFANRGKPSGADGGFSEFGYAGTPIKTSRHVDNGLIAFLKTDTWKLVELKAPGFQEMGGGILDRVASNLDAWGGVYAWYYNVVCLRPNANLIQCGFTL